MYFIFFIAIFTASAYFDIKNKENFIKYNKPVKVYILIFIGLQNHHLPVMLNIII